MSAVLRAGASLAPSPVNPLPRSRQETQCRNGDRFILTSELMPGTQERSSVTYDMLGLARSAILENSLSIDFDIVSKPDLLPNCLNYVF